MPIVEGVEQQTPEWLAMRVGCVTGSRVADVMDRLKGGGQSQKRKNYKAEIVCEILTGRAAEHYVTPAMEWGIENEPIARAAYGIEVAEVETVGFALHPTIERFGASPDGLVGADGLVEFKCPQTSTHLETIMAGVIPPQYEWQMFAEMVCADRQFCDFVSYDPRLPKGLQMFIRRLQRDDARIAEMEAEIRKFLDEVALQLNSISGAKLVELP
jgi:putative phage-type endonuclease